MTASAVLASPPSRFSFDERSGRYRAASGRYVRATVVRDEIDRVLVAADSRARALADLLRQRKLSVQDWELAMRREIKRVQIIGYAAAAGGTAQLSPADYGRIGAETRQQYAYLRRFRQQIEQGMQDGSYLLDGRFLRRAELYTEAGRQTYHAMEVRRMDRLGYAEYHSVRHATDSCEGAGSCIEASEAGWSPIGTLVPIGERLCGKRCRCSWEFRKGEQADGIG